MKKNITKNNSLIESLQNGNNRCCPLTPDYKITYFHGGTWFVCSKCFGDDIWHEHINTKISLNKQE